MPKPTPEINGVHQPSPVESDHSFTSASADTAYSAVEDHLLSSLPPLAPLSIYGQACNLTSQSGLLLSHYMHVTGPLIANVPLQRNAFVTHLLPLACSDDLLMHSVLALSGTHLAFKCDSDTEIQTSTWKHYDTVIKGLRQEFVHFGKGDVEKALSLLLVLIVLCHYEILSGDMTGTVFQHLRASRELVLSLLSHSGSYGQVGVYASSLGLCLELYAYIVIANSCKPQSTIASRMLPYDSFIFSLDELSSYPTFGTMFGNIHGLFELIPKITLLAAQRLAEEADGADRPSMASLLLHKELEQKMDEWYDPGSDSYDENEDPDDQRLAAEIFQHAIRIYLLTSLAGSLVSDPRMLQTIQSHVDAIIHRLGPVKHSQCGAIMLWPIVIAGSCMTAESQRQRLVRKLKLSRYRMKHTFVVCGVLEKLWATEDPKAFGPYGLSMMEHEGLCIPML